MTSGQLTIFVIIMTIFFKSATRNFVKGISLNLINIVGIGLGLTITTLCFLLIQYEFSFDKNFKNVDNIYRIIREDRDNNGNITFSRGTSSLLSPSITETCPDVLHAARYFNNGVDVHQPNSKDIFNEQFAIIDKEFFDIFSLKFVKGNAQTSLSKPFGVVLSLETATRIFKDKDPLGQSLIIQGFYFQDKLFEVTGVVEDLPQNSSISIDMLSTESSFLPEWLWRSWPETSGYLPVQTYIQTEKGVNIPGLNDKLDGLIKLHFTSEYQSKIKYHIQPLKRIHLYSNSDYSFGSGGNINYIYFFLSLSILIMSLVMINFLNVSNTLFQRRLIEIGVKKAFGSSASGFIVNFLIETLFLIIICLPITFILVGLAIPLVNQSVNSNITLSLLTSSSVFIRYLVLIICTAVAFGIIPAYRFSLMKPVMLLSKQVKVKRKIFSHNILMLIQFCIVIILIISTLHIRKQFNYLTQKDLGFNKENVIMVPILSNDPGLRNRCEEVKEAFMQNPDIIAATTSHALIGMYAERHNVKPSGHEPIDMLGIGVDADYIPFFGLKIIEGRNFMKNSTFDENSVILNKKAVDVLGWDNAVGRAFEFRGRRGQVIGVVDNFHINGLDQEIKPAYLQIELPKNWLALKYKGTNVKEINQFIQDKQVELSPNSIPQSFYLADILMSQYGREQITMRIFGIFSILAILLSCIGLLGIVMEVCQSRIKEIGIRKVNGAKVSEVMILLNTDFVRSISIAFLIAIPIAWYAMHQWLESFAYKINLNWWIFVMAGLLALGIVLLTVSWQSWIAARRNPVDALRNE
jgi:putative ABC transport system permease protein